MALDLVSNSFTKEEWLDDPEIPCKIEEEEDKKSDTLLNVDTKGEASGVVKFNAIDAFSKEEEVELEQVEPKGEPLCYSVKLDDGPVALHGSTLDPLGKAPPYFCHACDFVSNSSGTLLYHVNSHENEIGDPGGNVHYGYDVNSISARTKKHKVRNPLACDHCDFTSTMFRDMKKHEKIHSTSFACDRCDFETTSKKSLASHKNIHFFCFACGICSYKTRNRNGLQNHMMNHAKKLCPTEEKGPADPRFLGLKCRQCDHVAKTITGLNKHVDSHRPDVAALDGANSNIPPGLECDQCDFKGAHERALASHYNLKHKIICQYCRLSCADRKSLNQHIVDAHNGKPSYLVQLKKSARIKATKKEVFCDLCGCKYSAQWHLDYHMKKIHNAIIMQPRKPPKMSRPPKLLMLTGNGLLD